jgi:hypothetical protein
LYTLFSYRKIFFKKNAAERHNSVDAVNAGVGRLLQQLHDRQIALNEMSLSSQVGLCVVVPSLFLSDAFCT